MDTRKIIFDNKISRGIKKDLHAIKECVSTPKRAFKTVLFLGAVALGLLAENQWGPENPLPDSDQPSVETTVIPPASEIASELLVTQD